MRYFIDTEFYERPGHIDLISLGVVSEDGRELYVENSSFSWDRLPRDGETVQWLNANVRPHMLHTPEVRCSTYEMRGRLLDFVGKAEKPEFWGWYCDYDWVVFAWIFGRMVDLPAHFPKFCRDLRQAIEGTGLRAKDVEMLGTEHNALADARWNADLYRHIEANR